ncbi:uncharacterized protein I303_100867 [Kwoniella dejecticola CBS 10117]|uniref:Nucleolar pre-ribosomal-associated protein 1 n=1 Tax=Kwoniella dejecticola CBS 10117 TaxID=1296121 RepID=A0AAJ8MEQ4_9TREE
MVGLKRKRDLTGQAEATAPVITRPKAGTKAFASGKSVKDALATASPQAFVSFRQQIATTHSALPLAINNPTVVIIQHYLDTSPTCEEIFRAWQIGDQTKTEIQAQAAVELLSEIINILTPIPFFRSSVIGLVNKLVSNTEPYNEYLNRLCQSGRRDDAYHGFLLAAAAVAVDPPTATSIGSSTSGRLGLKVWSVLVEGGSVRGIGKQMGMRRRNKEGMVGYGEGDPLDKPDIRHLILRTILPLLSTSAFQAHARSILPSLYSGLTADPPMTIYRILTSIWNAISGPSVGLNRRTSLVMFHEKSLEHLWQLLSRQDVENTTGKTVSDIAEAFLEGITTVPGQGICFADEGWYLRRKSDENSAPSHGDGDAINEGGINTGRNDDWKQGLHNRILGNVVRRVGNKAVDDDGRVGSWMTKIFEACPELVAGYWAHSALAVEPRLNARWVATMAYIGRIVSLPPPPLATFRQATPASSDASLALFRSSPPSTSIVIESVLPSPFTKSHIMKGLQHTDGLVQHVTAITLARCLQKLSIVQDLFLAIEKEIEAGPTTSQENPWIRARRELEMEARKRIPELSIIVAFAQKAAMMAPSEPETEAELALASKSAMLTESALRIFSLCNKTIPSLASEMKFDVGRLLVSASSASAERRARREAREGSVISFEALSQLHVLRLLGEVKDWNWMNKAAGSQYTYLYHILLLNLSTRQAVTQAKTVVLLEHLLVPTLLFEHDPSELTIWLEALPRASDNYSGPMLLAQQIHLLSFLDDCFRRAIKLPYRYLEDSFAIVPDYFEYSRPTEMISPVLMAILEQLGAKIMGQLISTEAAGVVLVYMRRIILGLAGKSKDFQFLSAIIARFEEMLDKAKGAGQARIGLLDVIQDMKDDLALIQGKRSSKKAKAIDPEGHRLREEDDWTARSFEQSCLSLSSADWAEPKTLDMFATSFIKIASEDSVVRWTKFLLHCISPKKGVLATSEAKRTALSLLNISLGRLFDRHRSNAVKIAIFENSFVKDLYLTAKGDEYRAELNALTRHLQATVSGDVGIGESLVLDLVDTLKSEKKAPSIEHILSLLDPWTRSMPPATAVRALKILVKRVDSIADTLSPTCFKTIASIVTATKDPVYAIGHLKDLIRLKCIAPVLELTKSALMDRHRRQDLAGLSMKKSIIRDLFASKEDPAFTLIGVLAGTSKDSAAAVQSVLLKDEDIMRDQRVIQIIEVLLDLPSEVKLDVLPLAMSVLSSASSKTLQESAIRIIGRLFKQDAERVSQIVNSLQSTDYSCSVARLLEELIVQRGEGSQSVVKHLIGLGLRSVVRVCSKIGDLTSEDIAILTSLEASINISDASSIDAQLAEPVITAVIQDRLGTEESVKLASALAQRVEMKASFIRQQLQALLASPAYNRCIDSACPTSTRLGYITLLHTLFAASTYVSCQPNFIEPLVLLYRGTLSKSDRLVLNMFQLFEGYRKLSVSSVLKFWSASGIVGSGNRAFDALTSLDPQKVFATCQAYPLRRTLRGTGQSDKKSGDDESLYDPVFVMSLLTYTMSEGNLTGLDWVEILRSNVLGLTVCGLASRDKEVRAVAGYALAKAYSLILKKPFYERNQLLYTIRLLRHAIESPSTRLPVLSTLFFAHALRSLANPSHFLYPLTSRFLLQRPVFDPTDTPMLYSMLYASADGWKRERGWMIRFLKEGVRSEADWRIVRRRNVWSLLATLFSSSLDPAFRRSVLQAMEGMVSIPAASRSLVLRDGFIVWLSSQWTNISLRQRKTSVKGIKAQTWEKDEKAIILNLVERVCINMVPAEIERVKEGTAIGNWVNHVAIFFRRVLEFDVDSERLETLSRILYRISFIPQNTTLSTLLVLLTEQIQKSQKPSAQTILYLFEAGLNVALEDAKIRPELRSAVDEIGWRAERGNAGAQVAEWVKKERRLVEWGV